MRQGRTETGSTATLAFYGPRKRGGHPCSWVAAALALRSDLNVNARGNLAGQEEWIFKCALIVAFGNDGFDGFEFFLETIQGATVLGDGFVFKPSEVGEVIVAVFAEAAVMDRAEEFQQIELLESS